MEIGAHSVAHSLGRHLKATRVHHNHRCSVGRTLVQLLRRLPHMAQQVGLLLLCWRLTWCCGRRTYLHSAWCCGWHCRHTSDRDRIN